MSVTLNNSNSVTTSIKQESNVVQEPEKLNLTDSMNANDEIVIKSYHCNLCGKYFSRINHLNSHITQSHNKIKDKPEIKPKKKSIKNQKIKL